MSHLELTFFSSNIHLHLCGRSVHLDLDWTVETPCIYPSTSQAVTLPSTAYVLVYLFTQMLVVITFSNFKCFGPADLGYRGWRVTHKCAQRGKRFEPHHPHHLWHFSDHV